MTEGENEAGLERDGEADQDDRRSAGPDRAAVCHQHPGHPQHRHGGHVRNQNAGGLAVAGAEEGCDQLARDQGCDSDRGDADQRGDGERGQEAAAVPATRTRQKDERHRHGGKDGQPAECREDGELTCLRRGEHPVGNEEVLVLDDHQDQEGQRGPVGGGGDTGPGLVGRDRSGLYGKAVVAHGGAATRDLQCGEPGDRDTERAPDRSHGHRQGEPKGKAYRRFTDQACHQAGPLVRGVETAALERQGAEHRAGQTEHDDHADRQAQRRGDPG